MIQSQGYSSLSDYRVGRLPNGSFIGWAGHLGLTTSQFLEQVFYISASIWQMASASFSVCSLNAIYHKSPLFWQAYTWQHLSDILEEITINGEKRSLESLKGVGMKYPEGRCWEFFAYFYPIFYLLLFGPGAGKCHTQTSTLSRRVGLTSR